jgi:hypothetical protein
MTNTDLVFFTGVPGSRWSGIAQRIKQDPIYNSTDRAPHRIYRHGEFSGHCDSYFGTGMEFDTSLDYSNLIAPFENTSGTLLLMSHEWPYMFDEIIERYPYADIQLVYRPNDASLKWWLEAGGFNITYPNYEWYVDVDGMKKEIEQQNKLILDFAQKHMLQWNQHIEHSDIFVTTYINGLNN